MHRKIELLRDRLALSRLRGVTMFLQVPRSSMVRCFFDVCIFFVVFHVAASAGEFRFNTDPAMERASFALEKGMAQEIADYYRDLGTAKDAAVRQADPDEVQRIKEALTGKAVRNFVSAPALRARQDFDKELLGLEQKLQKDATEGIVTLLKEERVREAKDVKARLEQLAQSASALQEDLRLKAEGEKAEKDAFTEKTCKLEADKDWQNTGVAIPPGTQIQVSAEGRWAPGKGENDESFRSGDADTYNFELRIDGRPQVQVGGVKWTYRSTEGGTLMGRMRDYNAPARNRARGSVVVTFRWEEKKKDVPKVAPKVTEPLEYALARFLPDGGLKLFGRDMNAIPQPPAGKPVPQGPKKTEQRLFRLKLRADKDWQIYPIEVNVGDKVMIKAQGSWTPDADKKSAAGPEVFGYSYRVGGAAAGQAGREMTFTASARGNISLRIAARDQIVAAGTKATGELDMTVTVERIVTR